MVSCCLSVEIKLFTSREDRKGGFCNLFSGLDLEEYHSPVTFEEVRESVGRSSDNGDVFQDGEIDERYRFHFLAISF